MVDANQQWDRLTAIRIGRQLEEFDLTWIEEPLDAYDAQGHADLAAALDTPIATGEMLTSFGEHAQLIEARAADFVQPDAPRVGGITPFLQIMQLATTRASPRPALRDGDPRPPVGRLPAHGLGRALRMAGADVQRTAGDRRRPSDHPQPSRTRTVPERAGGFVDGGEHRAFVARASAGVEERAEARVSHWKAAPSGRSSAATWVV